MPSYTFNPHRHVKIWLSKEPSSFLNIENQLRIIRMRKMNPHDHIRFLFDSQLLNLTAMAQLHLFCEKHRLISVDIQTLLPLCRSTLELQLVRMYQDEIMHLGAKGGNLAAASDILRLLSPIYTLGNYSDFDVIVNTHTLPDTIQVKAPLLVRISSYVLKTDPSRQSLSVNNETWCVVDPIGALPYIKKIQAIAIQLAGVQALTIPLHQQTYQWDSGFKGSLLTKLSMQQTARQIRRSIHRLCSNNKVFYRLMLDFKSFEIEGEERLFFKDKLVTIDDTMLAQIARDLRFMMQTKLASSTPKRRRELEIRIGESDQSVLDENREEIHNELLMATVIGTTGPDAYMLGLFGTNTFSCNDMKKKVDPFALERYKLQHIFYSTNGYPLSSSEADHNFFLDNATNDSSWNPLGEQKLLSRQDTMQRAASCIQRFFTTHHKEDKVGDAASQCLSINPAISP